MDVESIHAFLSSTYWAKNIPIETVRRSIQNSFCIGVFENAAQVGFARMITDQATFAYLADVYILPSHRGNGLSKLMLQKLLDAPELQGIRRFMLATSDAQGLYSKFGYTPLAKPEIFMERHFPDCYR